MMKKILLALATAMLIATPAQADTRLGIYIGTDTRVPYDYAPVPRNYPGFDRYGVGYYGPIWLGRDGYYRCLRPDGRLGYLITRYGYALSRWNFTYSYYGTPQRRLRCR
jgi:opacity protein-like surface antigen